MTQLTMRLLQIPLATLARQLALSGAITSISAQSANSPYRGIPAFFTTAVSSAEISFPPLNAGYKKFKQQQHQQKTSKQNMKVVSP